MSAQHFEFNQQRLRKDGIRLARLAAFGEITLIVVILAIPLTLFAIGGPAVPTEDFLSFTLKAYITGPTAQPNLYEVLQMLLALLVLDRTRRLGYALSETEPLCQGAASHVRGLMWAMAAAILAMCFSVELTYHAFESDHISEWNWSPTWSWSATPLYLGVIVLLGLSIVERIIRHANLLDAEVQEFV